MPVQSLPVPSPEKFYRPCPPPASHPSPFIDSSGQHPITSDSTLQPPAPLPPLELDSTDDLSNPFDVGLSVTYSPTKRHPRSLRLRTGRGGRLQVDRLLRTRQLHPLLRAEQARWPLTENVVGRRRETSQSMEEDRWKNRDWRPENRFPAGQKVTDVDDLRQKYWAHESVFGDAVVSSGKRKREEDEDDEVIGFEQIEDGLSSWTDADWEKGPAEDTEWKLEPRSRPRPRAKIQRTQEPEPLEESAYEASDLAWRIDERWRYDSDTVRDEDRFLLDDYQPK